jgi:hypothetical protein
MSKGLEGRFDQNLYKVGDLENLNAMKPLVSKIFLPKFLQIQKTVANAIKQYPNSKDTIE